MKFPKMSEVYDLCTCMRPKPAKFEREPYKWVYFCRTCGNPLSLAMLDKFGSHVLDVSLNYYQHAKASGLMPASADPSKWVSRRPEPTD